MTQEMLIIAAVRVAGSLPVLRWPLLGGVLALLVDQSDLFMMNLIDLGGVSDYQRFDKYLDQVYMLAFLAVAVRWEAVPRSLALGLYGYRPEALVRYCNLPPSALEETERLEQLRFLENGISIHVAETEQDTIGVDTEEDLAAVSRLLESSPRPAKE